MAPMKTPPTAAMLEDATLSLVQAARRLNVTQSELRKRLGTGEIPFVEVSGKLRVPVLGLEAVVRNTDTHPAPAIKPANTTERKRLRKKPGSN